MSVADSYSYHWVYVEPSRVLWSDRYEVPFILEDGIGGIAPVHIQFVDSWEAFDSVRFRGMQGHNMVQERAYVLRESGTRREIDQSHA